MNRISIVLITILFLPVVSVSGQNKSDTIEVEKSGGGMIFKQNGINLPFSKLLLITKPIPEAYHEMKIARINYDITFLFAFSGGYLIGYNLTSGIGLGRFNWAQAGVGVGLIAIGVPFSHAYYLHVRKAVRLYNNAISQNGLSKIDFKIGFTCNGIGIKMSF